MRLRCKAFEIDCLFRTDFTLAEVVSAQANLLQMVRVRNVRGTAQSYLTLRLELDGRCIAKKAIRNLRVGEDPFAAQIEAKLMRDLALPPDTPPGRHAGRLVLVDSVEREMPFALTVRGADVIPTDFARAPLLAAYVRGGDELRGFAVRALSGMQGGDAADAMRRLHDALADEQLLYHPTYGIDRPDEQRISPLPYVLRQGGSCAELSLLVASLLWSVSLPPALLLFEDHMAAGCFAAVPDEGVIREPEAIERLVGAGSLVLTECTAVCRGMRAPFDEARRAIAARLARAGAMALVNVQKLLRTSVIAVPEHPALRVPCPVCGYVCALNAPRETAVCPACRTPLPMPMAERPAAPSAIIEEVAQYSACVRYALAAGGAQAMRGKPQKGEFVRVMPLWQGHAVCAVADRAFEETPLGGIALPETVSRIGDYAFRRCEALTDIALPPGLQALGTGAFRGSALARVRIPAGVKVVPRLAFAGCRSLADVRLSEGLERIGEKAFADCAALEAVVIPASVRCIEANAFAPACRLTLLSPRTQILL